MSRPETCLRCGSRDLILGADLCGYGSTNVHVYVRARPRSVLAKGTIREEVYATVCVACGHVEPFVVDTSALRRAYDEARPSER